MIVARYQWHTAKIKVLFLLRPLGIGAILTLPSLTPYLMHNYMIVNENQAQLHANRMTWRSKHFWRKRNKPAPSLRVLICYVILFLKISLFINLNHTTRGSYIFPVPQIPYAGMPSSGFDLGSWCSSWVMTSAAGDVIIIVSVVSGIGVSDTRELVCCTNWGIEVATPLLALSEVCSPTDMKTLNRAGMLATIRDTLP